MFRSFLIGAFLIGLVGCGGLNLFTVQDDKDLGAEVDTEIENNPDEYPILDENEFADAYAYLRDIRDEVLNSGEVGHRDDFVWTVRLIGDDEILNAFATPGGYLYFYTGLIKFLDSEDHFAGVMGHEIAHAAERHSTEALTKMFGIDLLLGAAFGNDFSLIQDIAAGLGSLAFSRSDESEADAESVIYLSNTRYACDGVAGFFQKLIDDGSAGGGPEFLSTHPNPDNRVADIEAEAMELGCDTTPSGRDYEAFKALLP